MPEFRLTQISDTHLARRFQTLTDNFDRVQRTHRRHAARSRRSTAATSLSTARPIATISNSPRHCTTRFPCPAAICPAITTSATTRPQSARRRRIRSTSQAGRPIARSFGEDRWRFEAAGWCFIGLNSLVMNTGLASEAEQFDWLASQLAGTNGKPVALFLHKPLYLNAPDDPELEATSIRYVPHAGAPPADRDAAAASICGWSPAAMSISAAISPLRHVRHIWAPSAGFVISGRAAGTDRHQGSRAGGIPLPARQLRGSSCQGAGPDRCRSGFAAQVSSGHTMDVRTPKRLRRGRHGLRRVICEAPLTPCPARRAPIACRNWRPSEVP